MLSKILLIFVAVLISLMTICHHAPAVKLEPYERDAHPDEVGKLPSIIQIFEQDAFVCTGIVVGPRYAITAAHCIDSNFFGVDASEVVVKSADLSISQSVKVVGVNRRLDYALLNGDFSKYIGMPVAVHVADALNIVMNRESKLVACGFPMGGQLLCAPFTFTDVNAFGYLGVSYLYPGMSGGPVIDMVTGVIVAVNTAQPDNLSFVSPLTEMWHAFGVEEVSP